MGPEGIVDGPQLAAYGDFAAWTSIFVDVRNVDTSDFEVRGVIGCGCNAELFVIMSVCPYLFWDPVTSMRVLRSEDRAFAEILSTSVACSLNSSTGPTCSVLSACAQALRRIPATGSDTSQNLLTMTGRSLLEAATKVWAEVSAQAHVFLIAVRLIFRRSACAKGQGPLGELGSSSGGQPPCRFFLRMTCRVTLRSCIFLGGVVQL